MDAGLLLSAISLAGLGIALALWLLVPHPAVPLGSLQEVNARRRDARLSVLWEEAAWPESGYVNSPLGHTHYYFLGPLDGEPLVFVHGITAGSPCFPDFIEGLAAAGFRVMTYDLYGRGFSASPGVHYDEGLYTTQLLLTVRALGWSNFHLVGLSLGGGIASSFSSQFPYMVKTLSLIAPAGLLSGLPPVATLLQTPWIGPILWHGLGRKFLIRLSERNYVQAKTGKTPSLQVKRTMAMTRYLVEHHPGVMRAYYSTVQHFPVCGMDETYRKLEKLLSGRVGVVWGTEDTVVPFALLSKLQALVPSVNAFALEAEGHSVVVENPDKCIECIKEITGFASSSRTDSRKESLKRRSSTRKKKHS